MNKKGFTLIELMIVIVICAIIAAIAIPAIFGKGQVSTNNLQFGYNGVIEERCISGYKFIIGSDRRAVQMLGENGTGVKCDTDNSQPMGPTHIK